MQAHYGVAHIDIKIKFSLGADCCLAIKQSDIFVACLQQNKQKNRGCTSSLQFFCRQKNCSQLLPCEFSANVHACRLCCVVGPAETVRQFVKELQDEGTFAKEVNSAGVAFHSPAVRLAAPAMRKALSKVW